MPKRREYDTPNLSKVCRNGGSTLERAGDSCFSSVEKHPDVIMLMSKSSISLLPAPTSVGAPWVASIPSAVSLCPDYDLPFLC